tara:strand:- start:507 stop:1019 length:513 start_codon:yes stop_codon:yes gene_type:complete
MKKSKEFILRNARKSDLDSYYNSKKNDKQIDNGFQGYKYPYSLVAAKNDLDRAIKSIGKKDSLYFIIDIDGKAIGEVSFEKIIPKLSAKIGYWIGKDYRGRGITTNAVKMAIGYVVKKFGLRRIYGNVRTNNKISSKVLEKCGFKLEGIQKKSGLKNGRYYDEFLYGRVR